MEKHPTKKKKIIIVVINIMITVANCISESILKEKYFSSLYMTIICPPIIYHRKKRDAISGASVAINDTTPLPT